MQFLICAVYIWIARRIDAGSTPIEKFNEQIAQRHYDGKIAFVCAPIEFDFVSFFYERRRRRRRHSSHTRASSNREINLWRIIYLKDFLAKAKFTAESLYERYILTVFFFFTTSFACKVQTTKIKPKLAFIGLRNLLCRTQCRRLRRHRCVSAKR